MGLQKRGAIIHYQDFEKSQTLPLFAPGILWKPKNGARFQSTSLQGAQWSSWEGNYPWPWMHHCLWQSLRLPRLL